MDAGQPVITEVTALPKKGNDDPLDAMVRVHDKVPEARRSASEPGSEGSTGCPTASAPRRRSEALT